MDKENICYIEGEAEIPPSACLSLLQCAGRSVSDLSHSSPSQE